MGAAWPELSPHSLFPSKASTTFSGGSVQLGIRHDLDSGGGAAAGPRDPEAHGKNAGESRVPGGGGVLTQHRAGALQSPLNSFLSLSASCSALVFTMEKFQIWP